MTSDGHSDPTRTRRTRARTLLSPRHAAARLLFAVVAGAIALTAVAPVHQPWWVRMVVAWDVGALTLVLLAWSVILRADAVATKRRAGSYDPGHYAAFVVALVSSLFSLFAAVVVLREVRATLSGHERTAWTLFALAAVALSWVLTHTAYTLRYAHLYYRGGGRHGLTFPGDEPPADIDFAYFAFTIGMCFQVSDVTVCASQCRRAVLLHSVLSFVYNTTILALALNIAFALMWSS